MEAFLFVVTIPTAEYEKILTDALNKTINSEDSVHNECETLNRTPKTSNKLATNNGASYSGVEIEKATNKRRHFDDEDDDIQQRTADEIRKETEFIESLKKSQTNASLLSFIEECQSEQATSPISKNFNREFFDELPLENVLEQALISLGISAISWTSSTKGNHFHISFGIQGGPHCERVLHELRACGIGTRADSTLSVLPCALHYSASSYAVGQIGKNEEMKDSAWSAFVRSVKSRLTVVQLLEQVKAEAALTFDFFFLLIVAALTAALGLAENSTVFLVASMLISPLMGPIMAGMFGTAIQDRNLQKIGIIHELIGVFVTMCVGFVFGLIICGIDETYGTGEWPTAEILSRCDVRSLWVGALVALPSGAAVAISVLGGNITSLVGVAISASLLPPAVNAGLLWAMSLVHLIFLNDDVRFTNVVKTKDYSENPAIELAIGGSISLLLTVVNIVCIFVAGIIVLMIKNVAPINASNETDLQRDIKATRDYNKKFNKENRGVFKNNESDGGKDDFETVLEQAFAWEAFRDRRNNIVEQFKADARKNMTWSPAVASTKRPTVQDLYKVYRRASDIALKFPRFGTHLNVPQPYSRLQEDAKINVQKPISQADRRKSKNKSKFTIIPVDKPNYQTRTEEV